MKDIFIKVSIKDHRFGDNFVNEIEFGNYSNSCKIRK